jgi:lytic murein transglycosylase
MDAGAIRAAASDFQGCLQRLYPAAAKRGIPKQAYDAYTRDLTPDLKIMDLVDAQPEFTLAFWDYLDRLVGEERIQRGRELLQQHRAVFDAMEQQYGVDRYVIAAIWGIESKYSTMMGERPVLRSTATLACVGRRQDYFRNEFLAAMEILYRGDVQPDRMRGSWAGAFGPTQFMPTVYKNYAVDADGDGHRDMTASIPDLLFSTANYFRKHGWETGQTWGYEVVLPQNLNFMLADRSKVMTIREWEHLGIRRAGGKAFPRSSDRAWLMVPAGSQGPGFLMLNNFRVIMRYNPAEAYALAIGHLSDRLRGGDPLVQAWPRHERVLTRDERMEMQQLLARRGFDIGTPDGRLGSKTRAAIRDFQARAGLVPDGFPSVTVLARLRGN